VVSSYFVLSVIQFFVPVCVRLSHIYASLGPRARGLGHVVSIYVEFCRVALGSVEFCRVFRVLSRFVEFCRVLSSFVEFSRVVSSYAELCLVCSMYCGVMHGHTCSLSVITWSVASLEPIDTRRPFIDELSGLQAVCFRPKSPRP
jgi:hypothetical protein